ncbi:MAG: VanW family protein [Actinobacteria bacterium]|nr:VanW family protein [Actinomycetota bacterium]
MATLDGLRVQSTSVDVRSARGRSAHVVVRMLVGATLVVAVLGVLVGVVFAGSPARVAEGVTVAGIDIGGLTATEALNLLEGRAERVARVPVSFTVGEQRFPLKASALGVEADWAAAVASALSEGSGFAPVRGYKRLQTRFLGTEIAPRVRVYTSALDFKLGQLATAIDRGHVEAKLVRRGLAVAVVPGQVGRTLDRDAAGDVIVRALAELDRGSQPVRLPVSIDPIGVTAADLAPAARQARLALSAPVRLRFKKTSWKLPRWRLAELIALPSGSSMELSIAGPKADAWFGRLRRNVERPPVDATFATADGAIEIIPSKPGLAVDLPATAESILAAAVSAGERSAQLALVTSQPKLTTASAQGLGIVRRLGTYTTLNAGTSNRITNLRRAIELLGGALVAPGGTFSFNNRVGPRTLERGFLPAPVIIRDEYDEDVGGGVSQVATTVFNAAWESGVKIVERNPHSLYISRYQLGRDATVNYPDLDLRFLNDTPKWILVAASWDGGSITVSLYGGGPERRVESGEGTMRVTGPARIRRTPDPTLERGTEIVEDEGSESRVTSVTRTVSGANGEVIHDETWNTSYRGDYRIIRVGTKPKPAPKPKKPERETPPPPTATPTSTTSPSTTTAPVDPPVETLP